MNQCALCETTSLLQYCTVLLMVLSGIGHDVGFSFLFVSKRYFAE